MAYVIPKVMDDGKKEASRANSIEADERVGSEAHKVTSS